MLIFFIIIFKNVVILILIVKIGFSKEITNEIKARGYTIKLIHGTKITLIKIELIFIS